MLIAILAALAFFILSNAAVEYANRATMNWMQQPMSAYLAAVKLSWLQDAGFIALAAALPFIAYVFGGGYTIQALALYVAAVALVVVVATKLDIHAHPSSLDAPMLEHIHIICAGIAFSGVELALLIHTWGHGLPFALTLAGPFVAFLLYRFAKADEADALEEKAVAALQMAAFISILIPMIRSIP